MSDISPTPRPAAKKLGSLPSQRCTEEYELLVRRCADLEHRTVTGFVRHAVTSYMLEHYPGMVQVEDGEVTNFGALQCDARLELKR